jgi:hypothetical protein
MASVIQSAGAQDSAAAAKRKERADESERTGRGDFAENLQNVIENTDRDSEVYADAEGTGSQGRPHSGEEEEHLDEEEQEQADEQPGGGLDVQA